MSGPNDKWLAPEAAPEITPEKPIPAGEGMPPVPGNEATPTTDGAPDGITVNADEKLTSHEKAAATQPEATDFSDFDSALFSGPEWRPEAAEGDGNGTPPPPPDSPSDMTANPPAPRPDDSLAPAADEDDEDQEDEEAAKPMGLMDHLNELRVRLVRSFIAVGVGFMLCWAVVDPIFDVLVDPLLAVLPKGSHAIYTTLPEGFFTRMYIAFVTGIFTASPYIFYQVWSFIAPGLYEEEKRYIIPVAIISALFFAAGGAFCYFVVFPYAFSFFVSFATESIVAMPKVSDYLSFVLKLILAFGLIFEMPLFALFLSRMGLITATMMRKGRRYSILAIFVVAAILTPPDVISQLLMACPMLLLYELSILVAAAFGRKKKQPDAEEDAEKATEDKNGEKIAEDA